MFQANKFKRVRVLWMYLAIGTMLAALSACSVSTRESGSGEDKKVDIKTPFAEIHVGSDTSAQDAGLALYPGARPKQNNDDNHAANVQIGGKNFGVKVIAATYLTNDPPQKVIEFYNKDMAKYGNVLQCPKGIKENHDHDKDEQLSCDDRGSAEPGKMDLAVGTTDRQHIVSVKPDGTGTEFKTVYIQVNGKGSRQTM